MLITALQPKFGVNYDVGYIGFTWSGDAVSRGIAWFERWTRMSDIRTCHTFIVSGPDELIESHIRTGVARQPLAKYFNDPHTQVFFRKPRHWSPSLGFRIAYAAAGKVGLHYDTWLIPAQALANCFLGRWINRLLRGRVDRLVSRLCDGRQKFICSELVAWALNQQPVFAGRGILASPLNTIDPQELFEDATLFEPWHNPSGHGLEVTPCGNKIHA